MGDGRLDCLLVHVPKLLEWSPLLGGDSRMNFLSMGSLSIAEELERAGLAKRIVHVGVEKMRDPAWSLVERVRASGAGVVAFALHTNEALDGALATMTRLGVTSDLYFVLGLPGDDEASVLRTLAFQRSRRPRHPSVANVFAWPLEMEPNAPLRARRHHAAASHRAGLPRRARRA